MARARTLGRPALSVVAALALAAGGCRGVARDVAAPAPAASPMRFEATAYSIRGRTADGTRARKGIVAADPTVLPLGTRIRVHGAGPHSGEYLVSDTGRAIKGRAIDIYVANDREATRFGRKSVRVEVLEHGRRPHH
jgi:3D (Asp-Asp-Asp) domain-containing protein